MVGVDIEELRGVAKQNPSAVVQDTIVKFFLTHFYWRIGHFAGYKQVCIVQ